uniref:Uncharacterized protein n=1 Tax=Picea glauca TaxID=3330 RepID=A0A101LV40_PICGL|nr:hypothetical protein ABT39_MTgene2256 [Picea glauca]QHR88133.1 hypothetical protein Q903MT_gene2146 [Picea sitchensis]
MYLIAHNVSLILVFPRGCLSLIEKQVTIIYTLQRGQSINEKWYGLCLSKWYGVCLSKWYGLWPPRLMMRVPAAISKECIYRQLSSLMNYYLVRPSFGFGPVTVDY